MPYAEDGHRLSPQEIAARSENDQNVAVQNAMDPNNKSIAFSSDPSIRQGEITGLSRGTMAYGQNLQTTGQNTQDIIQRRRAALNGNDPASAALLESRNREIAMGKARGANEGQVAQITRDANTRVDRQRFERQDKTLNDYQKLIGNVLGGQSSLEMGYAGLAKSGDYNAPPQTSNGLLGSVICTELFVQGYISARVYLKDGEHGKWLRANDPYVYSGYIAWAPTVVKWMKKSSTLTALIAIPGVAWAENMAGKKNILGKIINLIGESVCRHIGRFYGQIQSAKT